MSLADERHKLKMVIADFIGDALLPGQVAQRLAASLEFKPDPQVMARAIEETKAKVRLIIEQMPHLTSQSFMLRIPGPEFLELVLFSEYLVQNSLRGEKGALRYAKLWREPSEQTLAGVLNRLGFFSPADLEPFRQRVLGPEGQGQDDWRQMVASLTPASKEKVVVLRTGASQTGQDRPIADEHDQNLGAPALGGPGRPPRGLAPAGPQRRPGGKGPGLAVQAD